MTQPVAPQTADMLVQTTSPLEEPPAPVSPTPRLTAMIDGLCMVGLYVVIAAILFELVVLFGNLVIRNVNGSNWAWAPEVSTLAISVVAFIGGAVAYRRGRQPALTFLAMRLPERLRPVRAAVVDILMVAVPLWLASASLPAVSAAGNFDSDFLHIPHSWNVVSVPIGLVMFAIFSLDRIVAHGFRLLVAASVVVAAGVGVEMIFAQAAGSSANPIGVATTALIVTFAVLLIIGMPIALVLVSAASLYVLVSSSAPLTVTVTNLSDGASNFLLLAIPFFVLAGFVMSQSGLSDGLANFAEAVFGRFYGGSLHAVVFMMYIFSGLSGSKSADIAAVGGVLEEPMRRKGYAPGEISAVVAASAIMGETIPPCITLLILGSVTTISISGLFLGGILPAALLAIMLMVGISVHARRSGEPKPQGASLGEVGRTLIPALPSMVIPVVLIGGIVGGFASPTEVSSVAVVGAFILALCYRTKAATLRTIVEGAATTAGMVLFLASTAKALSWSIANAELPNQLLSTITGFTGSAWPFILITLIIIPLMGLALEGISALLIFAPVLVPIATSLGINDIQYGLVLVIAMSLGAFAPPIGWLLYETCLICHTRPEEAFRPLMRYYAILVPGMIVIAFVPYITTLLPHLFLNVPM
jgi:tripartite ATP-independent transporter DctM subunit